MKTKLAVAFLFLLGIGGSTLAQGIRLDATTVQEMSTTAIPGTTNVLTVPAAPIVKFCNFPANAVPCTNLATTFSSSTLGTPCNTSTQITLVGSTTCVASPDANGNFGFWAVAGNYAYTVTLPGGINLGPYNVTLGIPSGTNLSLGTITSPKINSLVYLDGVVNTTLAACYAAIATNGGACVVPPNYTETLAASLTMSKSGAGFIFLGPATITMGSNQVIVPAATHGVYLKSEIPFGGGTFATGKGVTFVYTGSGNAFQVGNGAGTTNRAFEFSDITVDVTGASSGATGLYMTNVVYFKLSTPAVVGNNSTTGTRGIVCDGTGNFCGTGTILNPYIAGLGTGILGTGSGGFAMNAAVIIGGTVGSSVVGAIGLDIENGDSSSVYGLDLESLAVAVKLGANAAGNFIRIRQESNTLDVQALAGSIFNVVQVERGNAPVVSDAGTSNQFSRIQDGKFVTVFTPVIQAQSTAGAIVQDSAGGNELIVDVNGVRTFKDYKYTETTVPAASGGIDTCYGDSTAHAILCDNNTGGYFQLAQVIKATSAAFATATTAGTCVQNTTAVTGATTAMTANASPVSTPGVGAQWSAFVSSAGNVTINECAVAASAGGSIAFNIRVTP